MLKLLESEPLLAVGEEEAEEAEEDEEEMKLVSAGDDAEEVRRGCGACLSHGQTVSASSSSAKDAFEREKEKERRRSASE